MASRLLWSAPQIAQARTKPTRLCRIAEALRRILSKPAGHQTESRVVRCGGFDRRCRPWGNRFTLIARRSLSVCPQLRTFSAPVGMAQTCQQRKSRVHSCGSRQRPAAICETDAEEGTASAQFHIGSICTGGADAWWIFHIQQRYWVVRALKIGPPIG
jgi:hypothetical protein